MEDGLEAPVMNCACWGYTVYAEYAVKGKLADWC